jgi:HK97 gp10 family phage protein
MKLSMDVDSKELQRAFDAAPAKVTLNLNQWINNAATRTVKQAKMEAPVKDGPLQSSIRPYFGRMTATVKPNKEYALYVHEGTGIYGPKKRPITPRSGKMLAWKSKGGTWAFARSVKGIKPNPYMEKAYQIVKPDVDRDAIATLNKIVGSI